MKYYLIDRRIALSVVYSSEEFLPVLHEYLTKVIDEIKILRKYGICTTEQELDSRNLCIYLVEQNEGKPTPFITNQFVLDYYNCSITHEEGSIEIPQKYPFTTMIKFLQENLSYVIRNKEQTVSIPKSQITTPTPQTRPEHFNKKDGTTRSFINQTKDVIKPPKINNLEKEKPKVEKYLDYECFEKGECYEEDEVLDSDTSVMDPEEIEEEIRKLENMIIDEEEKLEEIQEKHNKNLEEYSDYISKLNDEKRKIRNEKEREEERRRMFESDKNTYLTFKQEIREGKREESNIPDLFLARYQIYEFMDEKNLLDTVDEYELYVSFYDELYPKKVEEKNYVPHNINYLDEEEQAKYSQIKTEYADDIDELLHKVNDNKYPPLEEMLKKLDQEIAEDDEIGEIEGDLVLE